MSKFQNHFSPRKKSFFDPIFFLVKNMYLDFTIKAVRKRFAQMVHFRSTIPRNLLLASFIQCGLHVFSHTFSHTFSHNLKLSSGGYLQYRTHMSFSMLTFVMLSEIEVPLPFFVSLTFHHSRLIYIFIQQLF